MLGNAASLMVIFFIPEHVLKSIEILLAAITCIMGLFKGWRGSVQKSLSACENLLICATGVSLYMYLSLCYRFKLI